MAGNTPRVSWAWPLACWGLPAPVGSVGRTSPGEGRPLLLPGYRPEVAQCAAGDRCALGSPPRKDSQYQGPDGLGPGLRWPLRADSVDNLYGATGAKRQDPHGLRPATSLDALVELFPAPSPAWASGFQEKLSLASECLLTARREIQRSVRTPISLHNISVLSDLLSRVNDLLAADSVAADIGRPVSGQELIDTGYQLLDSINEYYILAQHFYSDEVQAARARRPSDAAEAEIAVVARKAAALKLGVLKYLKKAGEALQKKVTPLS